MKPKLRLLRALLLLCVFVLSATAARANPITWYLSGVTVQGGTVSGSFTLDNCPGWGCITSFDIMTSMPALPPPPAGHPSFGPLQWRSINVGGPDDPALDNLFSVIQINHDVEHTTAGYLTPLYDRSQIVIYPSVDLTTTSLTTVPIDVSTPIMNFPGSSGLAVMYYDWVDPDEPAAMVGELYFPFLAGTLTTEPPGPAPVPEPSTLLLIGSGLVGAVRMRAKRRG